MRSLPGNGSRRTPHSGPGSSPLWANCSPPHHARHPCSRKRYFSRNGGYPGSGTKSLASCAGTTYGTPSARNCSPPTGWKAYAAPARKPRKPRKDGDDPKARFSEFAKLYLNLTDKDSALPAGIADIRDIYDKVVLDEINESDKPDGELFRKGDVEIQGPHGLAIHNGVKGEGNIGALLTDMIHLATSDEIPRLQSAIMSHFLFEYVHPFYDGNGRTGRYLLALYLNHDLTMPTVLSLSRTIAENKNAYYKAFMEAEDKLNCGELTLFVNTILGFIRKAQDELIDELEVRVDQLDKGRAVCDQLERKHGLSAKAVSILYGVIQEEMFDSTKSMTLNDAAYHIRLSKQSARKYVGELMDAGLAIQSGKRPLKIRASESLKGILEAGMGEDAGEHGGKTQQEETETAHEGDPA